MIDDEAVDQLKAVIYQFPVTTTSNPATDESGATPLAPTQDTAKEGAPRGFLQTGRRNLSEKELSTPAARRFLIAEIERLDDHCHKLEAISITYHDLRVTVASLEEKATKSRRLEILSYVCLAVGAAGLGAAPSYLAIDGAHGVGWTFAIGSGVLVLGGILSRVVK